MKRIIPILVAVMFSFPLTVQGAPLVTPEVTFTTSGSNGNWVLDFSVHNNLGVDNLDIYMFGIQYPGTEPISSSTNLDYAGSPTNWVEYGFWNPQYEGGPDAWYVSWQASWTLSQVSIPGESVGDLIQKGETLSGFKYTFSTELAPTAVTWFAYAADWSTNTSPVPEPSTMLLLGSGLLGLVGLNRHRKA